MKAVLSSMKNASGGSVINISSINDLGGFTASISYDSFKLLVTSITKSSALDWIEYDIRVNIVHPDPLKQYLLKEDLQKFLKLI